MASPTILDSLFIELGLDSAKFRTGADDAERGARKAKDETEKSAKDIQKAVGEGVANAFQTATRRALEFFAVLAGARSIEQFAVNVTASATQLGIMSKSIGMTPDRLSAIAMAVERAGGSADATTQSMQRLKDMQTNVTISGGDVPLELQRLGVDVRGAESPEELLNRTVEAMARSPRHLTQSQQVAILRGLGVDDATAVFWVTRGAGGAKSAIDDAQKDSVTPAQVAAATKITDAWNSAAQAVRSVGREIMRTVAPAFEALLARVRELVEANKGALQDWVGTNVQEAVKWLTDPATWKGAKDVFDDIYKKIKEVADATGGWGELSKLLVGVWALNQISPIISAIGLLTLAFRELAASMLFAEGSALTAAIGALVIGYLVTEGTHPSTDADTAARAAVALRKHTSHDDTPITDEDIRKMKAYQKLNWFGRLTTTPEDWDEHQRLHGHHELNKRTSWWSGNNGMTDKPISTAEGPVSEGRPMPVKIVGSVDGTPPPAPPPPAADSSTPPAEAPAPEGTIHKIWRVLTGGDKPASTPAAPAAPASAPITPPQSSFPMHPHTLTPGMHPAAAGLPRGHMHITDPNTDPLTSHAYPAPGEKSSSLGGSSVFASGQAHLASLHQRGSSKVQIASLNITPGAPSSGAKEEYYRKHIKQDFYVMKSDVGLA